MQPNQLEAYALLISPESTRFILAESFKHYLQLVADHGAQLGGTPKVRAIGNQTDGTYQMHYFTFADPRFMSNSGNYVDLLNQARYGDVYARANAMQFAGPSFLPRGREQNRIAEHLCGPVNLGARHSTDRGMEGPVYVFLRSQQSLPFVEMLGDAGQMLNVISKVVHSEQQAPAAPPSTTTFVDHMARALHDAGLHAAFVEGEKAKLAAAEANLADKLAAVDAANQVLDEIRDPDYAAKQEKAREGAAQNATSSTDAAVASAGAGVLGAEPLPMEDVVASGAATWPPAKPFEMPAGAKVQILLGRVGVDDQNPVPRSTENDRALHARNSQTPVPAIGIVGVHYSPLYHNGPDLPASEILGNEAYTGEFMFRLRTHYPLADGAALREMVRMKHLYPNARIDQLKDLLAQHNTGSGWGVVGLNAAQQNLLDRLRDMYRESNETELREMVRMKQLYPGAFDSQLKGLLAQHRTGWASNSGGPYPSPFQTPLPPGVNVHPASAFPPAPTVDWGFAQQSSGMRGMPLVADNPNPWGLNPPAAKPAGSGAPPCGMAPPKQHRTTLAGGFGAN